RADSVALVVPETEDVVFTDSFFPEVLRAVSTELAIAGLQLVLSIPHGDAQREQLCRFAADRHVDGLLLISAHARDPLPAALLAAGVPLVTAGRSPLTGMSWVDVDNAGGARTAVEHLLGRGCRRVVTIAGPQDMSAGADRLAGWREALLAAGHEPVTAMAAAGDFTKAHGEQAMHRLLARWPDLDGVFCASDLLAAGALETLRAAGRRVPDDVAVVGFDDRPLAQHLTPPLTTVRQPVGEIGRQMTRTLLGLLDAPGPAEATSVVLPTHLVRRGSG
uniref:LacI family DNA-binding transcriptional regulator n=1 Tax=Desertihabitans aurantiacus TaxID=2282477 RepID=UPI000DF850CB